jgi:hypothetical protein
MKEALSSSQNAFVIYTAIFGNYDVLQDPEVITPNVDYICFTDNKNIKSRYWKCIFYKSDSIGNSAKNRHLKLLAPFNELKHYKHSLYIDGNIIIKNDLTGFFEKYKKNPFCNFKHPVRDCIFDEIEACLLEKRGNPQGLIRQGIYYAKDNMVDHFGLSDNKILLRENNKKVEKIMLEWWHHVETFSGRDQVCLPYVLFKNGTNFTFFDEDINENKYFEIWPHRNEYLRRIWRSFQKSTEKKRLFRPLVYLLETKVKQWVIKF